MTADSQVVALSLNKLLQMVKMLGDMCHELLGAVLYCFWNNWQAQVRNTGGLGPKGYRGDGKGE